jgi:hypothetical protein
MAGTAAEGEVVHMAAIHQISAGVETKARGATKNQRDRIPGLLIKARGAWVPLPEIMACAAQYNPPTTYSRRGEEKRDRGSEFQTPLLFSDLPERYLD